MTKKQFKQFSLLLISGITFTAITIFACGGGEWDPTEGSMFTPEIIGQEKYTPFFRTLSYPFYGEENYDDGGTKIFVNTNVLEWKKYLENKPTEDAVSYWLYRANLNQIDSMIFALKDKPANLSNTSLQYSLKGLMSATKAISFLYYTGFAKRNELFAVKEIDSWNAEPKKQTGITLEKQIAGGLNFFSKCSDPFLKERYAFQLVRLYYFSADFDNAISFYDLNISQTNNLSQMKWRSLGYKAASLYKQKKFGESNAIYALIYDQYEPMQKSAYLSFHPLKNSEWNQYLALAKSIYEKEVLWQLFGLYNDDVMAMKELIKLNSGSDKINLLLVRAVNKEEEKISGILVNDLKTQTNKQESLNKDLIDFLNLNSSNTKLASFGIINLAAAYLNYLNKDFALADSQLKRAEGFCSSSTLLKSQYHIISAIGKIRQLSVVTDKEEKNLLVDLKSIFSKNSNETVLRVHDARNNMRKMLAGLYKKQGKLELSELINPGVMKTEEDLKKMIAYLDNATKSDFELIFIENALLNKTDYTELLAIRYAQKDRLPEALALLKSIPKCEKTLLGNPFTIHIKDCHDCDHLSKQKTKYTSTSFIEKMIEMKNTALSKPGEASQNYFLVANGFYNITYFGNARVFYDNRVDNSIYEYEHKPTQEENCEIALNYYLLAKEKSTDKEFKAKCTFMAAKCEQNAFFMNKPANYIGDFKSGKYFSMLKKEYAETKYYSEIINECSYFRTYTER